MERIDHILFRADTDFIDYFDKQDLPASDDGIEPCGCFASFIGSKAKTNKEIARSMATIE